MVFNNFKIPKKITSKKITLLVCSMTALASDAKKYSTSLSSMGWNSAVESDLGIREGISPRPCGR